MACRDCGRYTSQNHIQLVEVGRCCKVPSTTLPACHRLPASLPAAPATLACTAALLRSFFTARTP